MSMPLDVLEMEICRWSANLTAAEARWLGLLAEFDRRRGWDVPGCLSCAAWLAWQTSLDLRTAHEKVRVAHALQAHPRLAAEMATGALSYAKVRAISRIANVDNVDMLIEFALAATSNQVEQFVTAYRRHEPDQESAETRAHRERSVTIRDDGAASTITIRLPAEAAAVVMGCVDLFLSDTSLAERLTARRADAVLAMASQAVAHYAEDVTVDDTYLATIHLTPDVFDDETEHDHAHEHGADESRVGRGTCCVAPGDGLGADPVSVPRKSARRILCDAVVQGFRHGDDDQTSVGRGRRTVSKRLKRSLRLRDRGCRFPGCTHTVWVDAHHIVHWLDHGPTVPTNLVSLCRRHHRLVHEAGWTITGNPNSELWFHSPRGARLAAQPLNVAGDPDDVERHQRTARDGRCQWQGDTLDLPYAVAVITGNEHLHRRQRTRRTPQEE